MLNEDSRRFVVAKSKTFCFCFYLFIFLRKRKNSEWNGIGHFFHLFAFGGSGIELRPSRMLDNCSTLSYTPSPDYLFSQHSWRNLFSLYLNYEGYLKQLANYSFSV